MAFKMFTIAELLSKAFRENSDKQSGQISVVKTDSSGNVVFSDGELNYTQAMENNSNGQPIFIGLAAPGSAKSAASWQIRKITYSGVFITDVEFANSSNAFDQVWNDRGGLSYG